MRVLRGIELVVERATVDDDAGRGSNGGKAVLPTWPLGPFEI